MVEIDFYHQNFFKLNFKKEIIKIVRMKQT